jgi:hypothetical protein
MTMRIGKGGRIRLIRTNDPYTLQESRGETTERRAG